ncbi:flagellar biosynthetic protein FliO [Cedecea colo]|uniref:Flagellar protein n=1 Tax=Cedecea colo TaxID=2552946 RepID=A0ABX0VNL0_9ENTR|nr:flagellar biosynthetic protein FliO [Cedecea colo]NIY48657.1 flagellar biosynthetic protein FliO [Cedecea colo]
MNSATKTTTPSSYSPVGSDTPGSVLFNVGGALALVLLLIAAIAWITRRAGYRRQDRKASALLTVKCSQSLGQRERVVIVEVNDKWLLLGVTPANITCLATFDKQSGAEDVSHSPLVGDFQAVMLNMVKKRKPESGQ